MSTHRTNVLSLVLAGGSGTRLGRLTAWRSKPALPFGAQFRTIDRAARELLLLEEVQALRT